MHTEERQLEFAAAVYAELEKLHGQFMEAVAALKEPSVNEVELRCVNGELQVTCLGVELRTRHRLIAKDQRLEMLEYTFTADGEHGPIAVWSMYLTEDKRLYDDSALANSLAGMTNTHLPERLGPRIASKLMASELFSPRG